MSPALDDLLRDYTDWNRRNERAKAAYRAKFTRGDPCRYCNRRYAVVSQHEQVCSRRPD